MDEFYRVFKSHDPGMVTPLIVHEGHTLNFDRRPTPWAGWLWCWEPDGRSGWVPEDWVEVHGDVCVMTRDYDASELTVLPGDRLKKILVQAGWLLSLSPAGETGWVPLENLELLNDRA